MLTGIDTQTNEAYFVQVNGVTVSEISEKGYITIPEFCRAGDEIQVYFPMNLRVVDTNPGADLVCLAFGPYLLAALSEEQEFIRLPELSSIEREGDELIFYVGTLQFIPLAQVDRERYHVYFKR